MNDRLAPAEELARPAASPEGRHQSAGEWAPESNPIVEAELRRRIADSGRITFAEFMEVALYHPEAGYYSRSADIGERGDFVTSPVLHPAFGALMGRFAFHVWEVLGGPAEFDILEIGGGTGALAASLLDALKQAAPSLHARTSYRMAETSPAMRSAQKSLLDGLHPGKVAWSPPDEAPAADAVTGCVISNEVVDALPFHRVCVESGELKEMYVTLQGGGLGTATGQPSTPDIARYLESARVRLTEGATAEARLAALPWIRAAGRAVRRGCVVTVDHGYECAELYGPRFPRGTLMCYWRQMRCDDPLERPGLQDITARVDFTALAEEGERSGLRALPLLTQREFLTRLGIQQHIEALRGARMPAGDRLAERRALLALLDPQGLGNCKVLIQHKGLSGAEAEDLAGFPRGEWPAPSRKPSRPSGWDSFLPEGEI